MIHTRVFDWFVDLFEAGPPENTPFPLRIALVCATTDVSDQLDPQGALQKSVGGRRDLRNHSTVFSPADQESMLEWVMAMEWK
jgi:hypothetical protein